VTDDDSRAAGEPDAAVPGGRSALFVKSTGSVELTAMKMWLAGIFYTYR
jgi:hypothetical protein